MHVTVPPSRAVSGVSTAALHCPVPHAASPRVARAANNLMNRTSSWLHTSGKAPVHAVDSDGSGRTLAVFERLSMEVGCTCSSRLTALTDLPTWVVVDDTNVYWLDSSVNTYRVLMMAK